MPCSFVLRITDARAVHSPRDFDLQDGGGFWWLAVWRLGLAMGNRGVEGWEGGGGAVQYLKGPKGDWPRGKPPCACRVGQDQTDGESEVK